MKGDIDYELATAVGELSVAYEFLMHIAKLSPDGMFEAVKTRFPSFIEHFEAMEEPPESAYEFWTGFGSWTVKGLRFKYKAQWDQVLDAYFESCLHEKNVQLAAMWSDVAHVLKETEF